MRALIVLLFAPVLLGFTAVKLRERTGPEPMFCQHMRDWVLLMKHDYPDGDRDLSQSASTWKLCGGNQAQVERMPFTRIR
jgi:hypothetical protein